MQVKLKVKGPDGEIRGTLDNLIGMTKGFFLFKDADGDESINSTRFLVADPMVSIPQILDAPMVIIINEDGEPIFTGPPWNNERVAIFLTKVWGM